MSALTLAAWIGGTVAVLLIGERVLTWIAEEAEAAYAEQWTDLGDWSPLDEYGEQWDQRAADERILATVREYDDFTEWEQEVSR